MNIGNMVTFEVNGRKCVALVKSVMRSRRKPAIPATSSLEGFST